MIHAIKITNLTRYSLFSELFYNIFIKQHLLVLLNTMNKMIKPSIKTMQ